VRGRRVVGRVHLAVVMAAAPEVPDLVVGEVLDHSGGARVAAEEVLADEGSGLGLVGLVVPVRGGVHQPDQRAVGVRGKQRIPLPAPDDLDDVPARAAEERLQLLDDLAVAADRAVEALEVAVHHEGQVVQLFAAGDADGAEGLGLVHLAVAEERPDPLLAGVPYPAVVQVAVEPRLVDGIQRSETHGDGRELPEAVHEPGVWIGRQTGAEAAAREFLTEAVELPFGQPAFEERAGVDARRGVTLEEDLVAAAVGGVAAEEVVEADFVEDSR
jgi:hypothetical protein